MIIQEPLDHLLTCVHQVLLLAKPRERHVADSIVGMSDGDTTPDILRPAGEASQETTPDQVRQHTGSADRHASVECCLH